MKPRLLLLPLFAVLVLAAGCGGKKNPTQPQVGSGVDEYITGLPSWSAFSPLLTTPGGVVDDSVGATQSSLVSEDDTWYVRHTTPHSLTATPSETVTLDAAPPTNILYVGGLIQGSSLLSDQLRDVPVAGTLRAPLRLTIDILSSDNSAVVQNPDALTVGAAVQELIERAARNGLSAGTATTYSYQESYSLEQSLLSLKVSARYGMANVSGKLQCSQSATRRTMIAFFKQKMFTVSMVLPQKPSDLFNASFTNDRLQEFVSQGYIGPENPPVYVSSIEYGRVLMVTMSSTASYEAMKGAIAASYGSIAGGSVSGEHLAVLNSADIQVVTVGGNPNAAYADLCQGNLRSYFNSGDALTTAVPLAFTLYSLSDHSVAYMSETTSYNHTIYSADIVAKYSDYDLWRNEVLALSGQVHNQPTSAQAIALATERGGVPPGANEWIGATLTFGGSATSLPFDYALDANQSGSSFSYNDDEVPSSGYYPCLSVGDYDNYQNDDFSVRILPGGTANVHAIGIYVGDNTAETAEELRVYGQGDVLLKTFAKDASFPNSSAPPAKFLGVVSAVPLTRMFFDEGSSGDDIVIKDPCFGVVTASGLVPRSRPAVASPTAMRAGSRGGRVHR
jgi:hypothetical protein